jgi:alpha-methylacyl-CoA racemase
VGQVVDAAMTDASISLLTIVLGERAKGTWPGGRGENMADTGSHFYEVYETSDGGFISVGAIEPQFYAVLCDAIGADSEIAAAQMDGARWPEFKERLAALFRRRTRAEWTSILEGLDACAMPVLSVEEAAAHPQNLHRGSYFDRAGVLEPGPGLRYSHTPSVLDRPPPIPGEHTAEILREAGFAPEEIERLAAPSAYRPRGQDSLA